MIEPIDVTDEDMVKYLKRINLKGKWKLSDMREDVLKFSKFMINITLRDYQMLFTDAIENNQKLAIVKGRQIGFTTTLAMFALWAAWFNKYPSGVDKTTKIVLISKDDDAAKALLQQVKDFMYMGDAHMSKFLKGNKMHTTQLFSKEKTKDNVDELRFKNGSRIFSLPPTTKVRGKSPSIIVIDEMAFLNNPNPDTFFYTDVLPAVSETQGKIIVSSTPNGYGGTYYDIVDPDNKKSKHDFHRMAFPFTVHKGANYQNQVQLLLTSMDESKFKQEYLCDFTQNDISFFNSKKVKEVFDERVCELNPDEHEYICGVDYGMTTARTVITLCTEKEGIIYRIYYKEFKEGWDINGVVPFIEGLMDRFRINKIVVDHCPQGDAINKQMIEKGWNIDLFDFHTRKIETYTTFRNKVNSESIKTMPDEATEKQMLAMIQEESKMGKLMISKPRSGRDDIIDSWIMAASHFLETSNRVGCWVV